MDVGLHGTHRLSQHFSHFRVRKLANVPEHDRLSVSHWKLSDPRGQLVDLHALESQSLRARRVVRLAAVQLDHAWPHAPHPVPHDVDGDLMQPGPLFQLANTFRRIRLERAISTKEGV